MYIRCVKIAENLFMYQIATTLPAKHIKKWNALFMAIRGGENENTKKK